VAGRKSAVTEQPFVTLLRAHGHTGWQHVASVQWKVEGLKLNDFRAKPDFIFRSHHLAVFLDGCPLHATQPKTNPAFWRKKLSANRTRLPTRLRH
jgi:DNA mismatch endonuclease (patch repair protein)